MVEQKILIAGSGGREHAIGWALDHDNNELFFAPGNAGTSEIGENIPIEAEDTQGITRLAKEKNIDLVIIGPDKPLSLGLADRLQEAGINEFGPLQNAAYIESSKAFAKDFMVRNNISTARYIASDNLMEAQRYLHQVDYPIVIKASGLFAGKGVIIPKDIHEAEDTLVAMLEKGEFGEAGQTVVIEERLEGPELSVTAFTDGYTFKMMPYSRDHKRLKNGDQGPNTGGMGTIAPVPVDQETDKLIQENIVQRTIDSLREEGRPFSGVLYPGVILTQEGPKVLEINSRFGDPEAQVLLRLLDTNLKDIVDAVSKHELHKLDITWKTGFAVCIVIAAEGYPGNPKKGEIIYGLDTVTDPKVIIFHAGTRKEDDQIITKGGRVLNIAATDDTLLKALRRAYGVIGLGGVYFADMQHRRDIGSSSVG